MVPLWAGDPSRQAEKGRRRQGTREIGCEPGCCANRREIEGLWVNLVTYRKVLNEGEIGASGLVERHTDLSGHPLTRSLAALSSAL